MNKREFVAGGVGAVLGLPVRAHHAAPVVAVDRAGLSRRLGRTQRLPDLVESPAAATFAAYVGERFAVVGGPHAGALLVLQSVARLARCARTEQFDVHFEDAGSLGAATASAPRDGVRLLEHGTGQRLALYLERTATGQVARFNLLR